MASSTATNLSRRSPITQPGYGRGRKPANKGRKLPPEELTRQEVGDLLDSFPRNTTLGRRNRAMVWLMYRVGMKVGQVTAMERRHYQRGSDTLTIPATRHQAEERTVLVDSTTREVLDEWLQSRESLGLRPMAPFFCTINQDSRGRPLHQAYIRVMLRDKADRLKITKRVTPEGLRRSWKSQEATQTGTVESRIEAYVDEDAFRTKYPGAYSKWREAREFYLVDPVRHASRIGHDCREAMIFFATEFADRQGVQLELPPAHTVARVRVVLDGLNEQLGGRVSEFSRALLAYWGTVSDLAQRQEHAAGRERAALSPEDARRLVFQTMLVMYELDRTVAENSRLASSEATTMGVE